MFLSAINMKEILISEERQRRTFDPEALARLAKSIDEHGLLHPPVVRRLESGKFELVAGERRLRAIAMNAELGIGIRCGEEAFAPWQVPVVLYESLNEKEAYEVELEENVQRENLSWQERAAAEAKLHAWREQQMNAQGLPQTFTATASEIVGHPALPSELTALRENVLIAEHLNDPEIAKASSKKEALKILEKKKMKEHREKLAETFDLSEQTKHRLHLGDCIAFMDSLPKNSIDVVVTDPPYGVDASKFGDNFSTDHEYEDGKEYFQQLMKHFIPRLSVVCKEQSHVYLFCSFENFPFIKELFDSSWQVWPQPLIWSKGNGNAPWLEGGPKRTYECILYARRGGRECLTVKNDVIAISPVAQREHGAEKPVELYVELLSRSAIPGNTIADFFAGSGTIFPAADLARCFAIGSELNKNYYNIALERMMQNV